MKYSRSFCGPLHYLARAETRPIEPGDVQPCREVRGAEPAETSAERPRTIAVGSIGVLRLSSQRRFDALLDTIATWGEGPTLIE